MLWKFKGNTSKIYHFDIKCKEHGMVTQHSLRRVNYMMFAQRHCFPAPLSELISKVVSDRFTEWQNDKQDKNNMPWYPIRGNLKTEKREKYQKFLCPQHNTPPLQRLQTCVAKI